jgi:large subunit ribosomal protein L21e
LLKRKPRKRGKTSLSKTLINHKPLEKVIVKINPSIHKGMPHRRYHGRVGIIKEKRGRAYVIRVTQGKAVKEIIVRPEHLESYGEE